jgi:hypothetical protein
MTKSLISEPWCIKYSSSCQALAALAAALLTCLLSYAGFPLCTIWSGSYVDGFLCLQAHQLKMAAPTAATLAGCCFQLLSCSTAACATPRLHLPCLPQANQCEACCMSMAGAASQVRSACGCICWNGARAVVLPTNMCVRRTASHRSGAQPRAIMDLVLTMVASAACCVMLCILSEGAAAQTPPFTQKILKTHLLTAFFLLFCHAMISACQQSSSKPPHWSVRSSLLRG